MLSALKNTQGDLVEGLTWGHSLTHPLPLISLRTNKKTATEGATCSHKHITDSSDVLFISFGLN